MPDVYEIFPSDDGLKQYLFALAVQSIAFSDATNEDLHDPVTDANAILDRYDTLKQAWDLAGIMRDDGGYVDIANAIASKLDTLDIQSAVTSQQKEFYERIRNAALRVLSKFPATAGSSADTLI